MRNHGFLRDGAGWRLSPAFDVNPTSGDNPKYLRSLIDYDHDEADPRVAVAACEWFRMGHDDAVAEARAMASKLKRWRKIATTNGISKASQDYMASCMESGVERLGAVR